MADQCAACGTKKSKKDKVWVLGGQRCPVCGRIPFKVPKLKRVKKAK